MTCTMTHSALHFFEKLTFEKNPKKQLTTLNGQISKTRTNVESKLKFLESLIFFKTVLFFAHPTPVGIWQGLCPPQPLAALAGLQD